MRSISDHIIPLVINSLRGGHTDTHVQTDTHTHAQTRTHRDKQTDRQTDRQTDTHTHTHTQTNTHTHKYIHTLHGEDQFLETRCVLTCGWHAPALKMTIFCSKFV